MKPWQRILKILNQVDLVLEVVDARAPEKTHSERLEKIVNTKGKGWVVVINKIDLISEDKLHDLKKNFKGAMFLSAKKRRGIRFLKQIISQSSNKTKIKVAIVGYPNVGKSQLSNALKGRKVASVASTPGHTKGEQWIRVSEKILLFDTPGVIPKRHTDEELAVRGALNVDNTADPEKVAVRILGMISREDIEKKYGFYNEDAHELLRMIAQKSGKLLRGGEPDINNVSKKVIRDWYKRTE